MLEYKSHVLYEESYPYSLGSLVVPTIWMHQIQVSFFTPNKHFI